MRQFVIMENGSTLFILRAIRLFIVLAHSAESFNLLWLFFLNGEFSTELQWAEGTYIAKSDDLQCKTSKHFIKCASTVPSSGYKEFLYPQKTVFLMFSPMHVVRGGKNLFAVTLL